MKTNDGQCLNLVSFSEGSCTDSPGQDASPSQVLGTHLQVNILRQIGVN